MTAKEGSNSSEQEKFGSGTPGDQGTYSVVGAQPGGGGAGLGAEVQSGDGSAQSIAEAGGNPQHRNAPGPDLGEASKSASESYDETEQDGSGLRTGSGDRNTASGSSKQDRAVSRATASSPVELTHAFLAYAASDALRGLRGKSTV